MTSLALAATPIVRKGLAVDYDTAHRCPTMVRGERCNRLLVFGRIVAPIQVHCPKCKREIVLMPDG